MIFAGIDYIFGETEAVSPPGIAVGGNRADEKVTSPSFYDIVAELDAEAVYRYFDDKLPLVVRVLHRPLPRFVDSFSAHLHRHGGCAARLKFCPAYTDYRGGDFAIRLEDEFPAAFFGFPCADEEFRELFVVVNNDLDAVTGRTSAAAKRGSEEHIYNQGHESLHKLNFKRLRNMLQ